MGIDFPKSNKSKNKKSEKLTYVLNIWAKKKSIFKISNIRKIFNYLKQTFIKALIFWHFYQEYFILNKNNA